MSSILIANMISGGLIGGSIGSVGILAEKLFTYIKHNTRQEIDVQMQQSPISFDTRFPSIYQTEEEENTRNQSRFTPVGSYIPSIYETEEFPSVYEIFLINW